MQKPRPSWVGFRWGLLRVLSIVLPSCVSTPLGSVPSLRHTWREQPYGECAQPQQEERIKPLLLLLHVPEHHGNLLNAQHVALHGPLLEGQAVGKQLAVAGVGVATHLQNPRNGAVGQRFAVTLHHPHGMDATGVVGAVRQCLHRLQQSHLLTLHQWRVAQQGAVKGPLLGVALYQGTDGPDG